MNLAAILLAVRSYGCLVGLIAAVAHIFLSRGRNLISKRTPSSRFTVMDEYLPIVPQSEEMTLSFKQLYRLAHVQYLTIR